MPRKPREDNRVIIPYQEDPDELLANIYTYGNNMAAGKRMENVGKEMQEEAKGKLQNSIGVLAITTGQDPDKVDGIALSAVDDAGKVTRYMKVKRKGNKKIDEKKLLEAGVSADVIAACTTQGRGSEYWSLVTVNADGSVEDEEAGTGD